VIKDLTLFVIKRGDRYGICLRATKQFPAQAFLSALVSVKESARITARFVAAREKITDPQYSGQRRRDEPGYAVFQVRPRAALYHTGRHQLSSSSRSTAGKRLTRRALPVRRYARDAPLCSISISL
jgi:hypothetical protein